MSGPAGEAQQAGLLQVVVVNQHARSKTERAKTSAGLDEERPTNREGVVPNHDLLAHVDAELRQQLGSDQRSAAVQQRMRKLLSAVQDDLTIKRESALHAPQLDHPRDGFRLVGGAHHRCRFDRFDLIEHLDLTEPCVDNLERLVGPRLPRPQQHVGGREALRLLRQRHPHALDDGTQRDDRADTNRDADEEEREAPP